jgi:hypothetical protein
MALPGPGGKWSVSNVGARDKKGRRGMFVYSDQGNSHLTLPGNCHLDRCEEERWGAEQYRLRDPMPHATCSPTVLEVHRPSPRRHPHPGLIIRLTALTRPLQVQSPDPTFISAAEIPAYAWYHLAHGLKSSVYAPKGAKLEGELYTCLYQQIYQY